MCYKILFHLNILLGLSSCVWFAYSFTYEKSFKVCSDFWPLIVVTWPVRLTGRNNPMTDLTPSLLCVHVRCMRGNKMQKLKSCSFFLTSMLTFFFFTSKCALLKAGLFVALKKVGLQAFVGLFSSDNLLARGSEGVNSQFVRSGHGRCIVVSVLWL